MGLDRLRFSSEKKFTATPRGRGAGNSRALTPEGARMADVKSEYIVLRAVAHGLSSIVFRRAFDLGRISPYLLEKTLVTADRYPNEVRATHFPPPIQLAARGRPFSLPPTTTPGRRQPGSIAR